MHLAKVLYLLLVVTAANVSAEDLATIVENFDAEVMAWEDSYKFHYDRVKLKLQEAMDKISQSVEQMRAQGVLSDDKVVNAREKYKRWYKEQEENLSAAAETARRNFAESKNEVKIWVSMNADRRISHTLTADLIKEIEGQLPEIVDSAMYTFDAVHDEINKKIGNRDNLSRSLMSESSDDHHTRNNRNSFDTKSKAIGEWESAKEVENNENTSYTHVYN